MNFTPSYSDGFVSKQTNPHDSICLSSFGLMKRTGVSSLWDFTGSMVLHCFWNLHGEVLCIVSLNWFNWWKCCPHPSMKPHARRYWPRNVEHL